MRRSILARVLATAAAVHLVAAIATLAATQPADWPQYRGPSADGISTETGVTAWGDAGPAVIWRVPLGSGFSGLSAVGGRIYTLYGTGGKEHLGAFSAADGSLLWRLTLGAERADRFGSGPRATPILDGGTVYAVGALGTIVAADARSGKERWRVDAKQAFGARVPTWGVAAQLALIDGRLIHNSGGPGHEVVALDPADGSLLWQTGNESAGYSQPLAIEVAGRRQIVVLSGSRLLGLDPAKGTMLWSEPWKTSYDVNAATPIFVPPDRLFVSTGYDTGAALFRIVASGEDAGGKLRVQRVWSNRGMKNQFSSSVLHRGFIYGFDNKILKCLDAATGEERWATRGFGHGSLLWADGKLVILGDGGLLALAEATPEGYRELARAQPMEGKHWTVPTLYGGRLFIRNEKEMLCLKVSAG